MKEKDQKQEKAKNPEQPPPEQVANEHHHGDHHHGKDFAKKFGNAVTFGAGATIGSDAVNSIVRNL